ncbi:MAG: DEAD/DEAH box helicase, partial [Bacteroidia bacterium]
LGKTIQAISTAVFKKEYLGFTKTLIICPASLKGQWKSEIEKFCNEKAQIIEGFPVERAELYKGSECFFNIINYETVLRDLNEINKADFDFVVLDEAQRIKNFETLTATSIKAIQKKHALVITGTPIENHLIDLYAIVEFLYPYMLTPLWEFSYQHCYFDTKLNNKISGYYNLQELKERMKTILIRREKAEVLTQLNRVTQIDVPVEMHEVQRDYHASAALTIAQILNKKFKTPFDWQRILSGLQTMRMSCDSSYLVDKETYHSPKLDELKEILFDKLDLKNNKRKIIIFSEWRTMNGLIGKMLRENNIGYTELNGTVPVKKRKKLVDEFEANESCRVFLSTESGGSGLNLQMADTVINFELPWNPAKKNQRIGRIDRLGQTNKNLTVINLITRNSIELSIAGGLLLKQNLFDNVLNKNYNEDFVDFSEKGKGQFLKELEQALAGFANEEEIQTNENEELLQLAEEHKKEQVVEEKETKERIKKLEEMETIMQKGMDFLSGIFKMSTGKEMNEKDSKIEIDKETGEVVMRFKF